MAAQIQTEPDGAPTHAERTTDIRGWLLSAAQDVGRARQEWAGAGIALLKCDVVFSAVRVRAELVHAAAKSKCAEAIQAYLVETLQGGPVFMDTYAFRYYALVPPGTVRTWKDRARSDVVCLDQNSFLGVPDPGRIESTPGRSYWPVPMDVPGRLCRPRAVKQLIDVGRRQLALGQQESCQPGDPALARVSPEATQ